MIETVGTRQSEAQMLLETIRTRRSFSLKQLSPEPIDLEAVELMLEAANWAPSHGHTEPWRFTVFAGAGRTALGDAFGAAYRAKSSPERYDPIAEQMQRNRVWQAPVWISLGMVPDLDANGESRMPEWEDMISVGCAVHNAHMVATALGLGAKWTSGSVVSHPLVADLLGLAPPAKLLGFLYVGRPVVPPFAGARRPINDKVKWVTSDDTTG